MKIIQCKVPRDFTLYDSGDLHLGSVNTDKDGIREMFARVANDPKARLILKGDLIECMTSDDPRFDVNGVDYSDGIGTPLDQLNALEKSIEDFGIQDKIIAVGIGNHEARIDKVGFPVRDMCRRLGVPYMGWVCVVHYTDQDTGKVMFRHFGHHGRNIARSNAKDAIQRKANRSASVKLALDRSGFTDVLYFSMGHTHDPLVVRPTIDDQVMLRTTQAAIKQEYRQHTNPAANFIPPEARWYSITPSFLRLYSDPSTDANSYSEKAMYAPVKLGWNEVEVKDGDIMDIKTVEV